jgi:hypothetical protein
MTHITSYSVAGLLGLLASASFEVIMPNLLMFLILSLRDSPFIDLLWLNYLVWVQRIPIHLCCDLLWPLTWLAVQAEFQVYFYFHQFILFVQPL